MEKEKTRHILHNKVFLTIVLVFVIIVEIHDQIGVLVDPQDQIVTIFTNVDDLTLLLYIFITATYLSGGFLFEHLNRHRILPQNTDPLFHKGMNLLVWGIMFIGFAFVFYILINVSVPAGFADFWFIIITGCDSPYPLDRFTCTHLMGISNFEKNQNR